MSASFNSVTVVGNVTREIDVRYTPKGTAVAEIGLAVNESYKASDGERREKTIFLDIKLWGKQAEVAGEHLKKGSSVLFSGRLDQENWEDKQTGAKRSKIVIVATDMVFLGSKRDDVSSKPSSERNEPRESSQSRPASRPSGPPKPPADPDLDVEPDEIPFSFEAHDPR